MKQIDDVLINYNLDILKIESLDKGYASSKWIIYTKDGNMYVLKQVNKQSIQRVDFILNVESSLGDFCPEIILTKEDMLYYVKDNDIYYICEYIDFVDYVLDEDRLEKIGYLLADLHKNLKTIKLDKNVFLKNENNYDDLLEYLKYYKDNELLEYVQIIEYKLNILNELKMENIDFNNLDEQIIHGDFYQDNVLCVGNQYKVIDFDQCCHFYREYEIMRAMFMLCVNTKNSIADILENMRNFVKGYLDNNYIKSPIDAYNLYLYVQANSLSSIRPGDNLNQLKHNFALKRFEILKILYENKNKIIEILGDKNMRKPIQVLVLPYKYEGDLIKYMILKRADMSVWQGVAGGVEDGETVLMAAKRECFEEIGVPLTSEYIELDSKSTIPVNFIYGNFYWGEDVYNAVEYCYGVLIDKVDIVLSSEHLEYMWVSYDEAFKLFKWDSNRNALWELDQRLKRIKNKY